MGAHLILGCLQAIMLGDHLLLVRADGAGATHELLDWLTEQGQVRGRRLEYSVGFSTKNHGNHWELPDERRIATDIIAVRPTINGRVVAGEHMLVDAIVSVGSAEAEPTWHEIGVNEDDSRPWMKP